ncbi:hypothetical protein Shyhy01_74970 [Streptomyces hygroscopicus subsp. hygroscopicus]|nr:hypothetical protein Shyhy01_74970 [Streptomyces hygroscopicus subsp. hygroscopicus]
MTDRKGRDRTFGQPAVPPKRPVAPGGTAPASCGVAPRRPEPPDVVPVRAGRRGSPCCHAPRRPRRSEKGNRGGGRSLSTAA